MIALASPGLLILDACASLHAKQLKAPGQDPLAVIDLLVGLGLTLTTTPGVENEQVAMSLSAAISGWRSHNGFQTAAVSVNERRMIRNQLTKGMKTPGDRDIGLVALAVRVGGVLLTHDDAAAVLARKSRVITVDLLDLAALVASRSLSTWPDIEAGHSRLVTFAWNPADWTGTVQATVQSRPAWTRLGALLSAWP